MGDGYPMITAPEAVLAWVETTMWEEDVGNHQPGQLKNGAWLRAWPSGHVHYSRDWCTRLDGRFDTECGKARIYWPEGDWPKAKVCPVCAVVFRGISRAARSVGDTP